MLGILLSAQLVMSMGAFGYGPLAPYLRETYGISRSQVGSLISIFYFTCTLTAIPAGIIVDRIGARLMLILCLLMEGVPYAALSLAGNYFFLAVFSALGGIGYAFINQVSTKGIMQWFAIRARATAMGIKQSGVTIGGAVVAWLLPVLSTAYSWEWGVLSISLSMFLMALVAFLFYCEYPPEDAEDTKDALSPAPATGPEPEKAQSIYATMRQPMLLTLLVVAPFLAFSQGCLVGFLVLYLKEELHFSVEMAGACMTAAMIAATAGRIGWGAASDVIFRGDRVKPLIILSLVGGISAAGMAFLSKNPPSAAVFLWSMLLGVTLSGWNGLVMILSAELGGKARAASAVSIVLTSVGLGFLAGPVAFGFVADHQGYFASWMLVLASSLISVAGFLRIYRMKGRMQGRMQGRIKEQINGRVREGHAGARAFPAAGNDAGFGSRQGGDRC